MNQGGTIFPLPTKGTKGQKYFPGIKGDILVTSTTMGCDTVPNLGANELSTGLSLVLRIVLVDQQLVAKRHTVIERELRQRRCRPSTAR